MRIDKFTVKTQEAIAAAQGIAERLGQQAVDVEHVLLALLQQRRGRSSRSPRRSAPTRRRSAASWRRRWRSCPGSAAA